MAPVGGTLIQIHLSHSYLLAAAYYVALSTHAL